MFKKFSAAAYSLKKYKKIKEVIITIIIIRLCQKERVEKKRKWEANANEKDKIKKDIVIK